MKIGILTLPLHSNYGGLLQAYALQKYLKNRGHDVIIIDRQFDKSFISRVKEKIKDISFRGFLIKYRKSKILHKNTDYFINKYINPRTVPIYSSKSLKKKSKKYCFDLVIVGSDQVWRIDYTGKRTLNYFCNFLEPQVRKISYAASFGKDNWGEKKILTKEIENFLKNFEAISVREHSGVDICSSTFQLYSQQHIDPTLLLQAVDYNLLIENEKDSQVNGNILSYTLDDHEDKKICQDFIVQHFGGVSFKNNKPTKNTGFNSKPSVTYWLKSFAEADFVFTDSFHGTIFSLIYNKPFLVYGNEGRGLARFISILKHLGLENRLITNSKELTKDLLENKIDWPSVNRKIQYQRSRTNKYFDSLGL